MLLANDLDISILLCTDRIPFQLQSNLLKENFGSYIFREILCSKGTIYLPCTWKHLFYLRHCEDIGARTCNNGTNHYTTKLSNIRVYVGLLKFKYPYLGYIKTRFYGIIWRYLTIIVTTTINELLQWVRENTQKIFLQLVNYHNSFP